MVCAERIAVEGIGGTYRSTKLYLNPSLHPTPVTPCYITLRFPIGPISVSALITFGLGFFSYIPLALILWCPPLS